MQSLCTWLRIHILLAPLQISIFIVVIYCAFSFLCRRLGVELGKSVVYQEPNRGKRGGTPLILSSDYFFYDCCELIPCVETRVDVKESVRGQDIFIIQTIPR